MHSRTLQILVAACFAISLQMSCCWKSYALSMVSWFAADDAEVQTCCSCCGDSPADPDPAPRPCPRCQETYFKVGVAPAKPTTCPNLDVSVLAPALAGVAMPPATARFAGLFTDVPGVARPPPATLLRLHCALIV